MITLPETETPRYEGETMHLNEAIVATYRVVTEWGPDLTYTNVAEKIKEKHPNLHLNTLPLDGCVNYGVLPDETKVPVCLVGQVLAATRGLDLPNDVVLPESSTLDDLASNVPGMFSERAQLFLSTVQGSQDVGNSWGEAFYEGLRAVGVAPRQYPF
jgi:hypothetical protein